MIVLYDIDIFGLICIYSKYITKVKDYADSSAVFNICILAGLKNKRKIRLWIFF